MLRFVTVGGRIGIEIKANLPGNSPFDGWESHNFAGWKVDRRM